MLAHTQHACTHINHRQNVSPGGAMDTFSLCIWFAPGHRAQRQMVWGLLLLAQTSQTNSIMLLVSTLSVVHVTEKC